MPDGLAYPRPVDPLESTVWMIHARTTQEGVKGTLRLEPGRVAFRPAYADEDVVFPLQALKRARRFSWDVVVDEVEAAYREAYAAGR